jgi:hypothetical protein
MKNIITLIIICFFSVGLDAQTVQAMVDKTGENQITIYGKSNIDLTNVLFENIYVTVSIPDQGGNNPTLTILTNNVEVLNWSISEYTLSGRRYYDISGFDNSNGTTESWTAATDNAILVLEFGGGLSGTSEIVQLNDLTSSSGGTNGITLWYMQINVIGDITNYAEKFYGTNPVNSEFGDSQTETAAPVSLPINLRTFTAEKHGDDEALLQWTSSSEVNSSHYEVERSMDNSNWEKITVVKAAGDSHVDIDYEYIDTKLPIDRNTTIFYYRLRMVDNDGEFDYSDVRKVSFTLVDDTTVKIYPNPANSIVRVNTLTSQVLDKDATTRIFDVNGKIIFEQVISENGINSIDISRIPANVYFIEVNIGTEQFIEKLVIVD